MANSKHLAKLRKGVASWNRWRNCSDVMPNLSNADLSDIDLSDIDLNGANLSNANLSGVNLHGVDLSGVNLRGVDLSGANLNNADLRSMDLRSVNLNSANLSNADLRGSNLSGVDLRSTNLHRANLRGSNLRGANLNNADLRNTNLRSTNLSGANLNNADLRSTNLRSMDLRSINLNRANLNRANLRGADLRGVDLRGMDLGGANLIAAQVLTANLEQATLTGAIIENWHIGSSTKLDGVKCDYIFRKRDPKTGQPTARLPVDPKSTFVPGEFVQLYKIYESALETIDLTFTEGIDWKAFFASFQELRQQYSDDEISIQGIERKGEVFIVRLEVSQEADKGTIETQAKQLYEMQLKALESQYEKQLRLQGEHLEDAKQTIETERREKATLMGIVGTMANNQQGPKYDLRGTQFSGGFAETVEGDQIGGNQYNYATLEKQSLADAALEIQRLLKQLEETNPTATEAEQKAFVTAAIPLTLRQRAVGALQSGGRAAVEQLLDNPYVNVALAVIEGWQTAE